MRNTARQTRDHRTITVDFHDETTYFKLLDDRRAFVEFVLAFLLALGVQLKHQVACRAKPCSPSCHMSSCAIARCDPMSLAMR